MKTKFPTETIINIKTSGFFYSKIETKNLYDLSMQVSSRDVFITTGVIYFIFGIIGKISAVFLTIPYPVLGGVLFVMYGMFIGVVLSNLQVVSLSSSRNLAIMGTAILFGLVIPYWLETNPDAIQTGFIY